MNPNNCPDKRVSEFGTCKDEDDDYICDCYNGFSTHPDGHSVCVDWVRVITALVKSVKLAGSGL